MRKEEIIKSIEEKGISGKEEEFLLKAFEIIEARKLGMWNNQRDIVAEVLRETDIEMPYNQAEKFLKRAIQKLGKTPNSGERRPVKNAIQSYMQEEGLCEEGLCEEER